MAAITPIFGSADLSPFFGSFSETIVNRLRGVTVPQRDGNIEELATTAPKNIILRGSVFGETAEEVRIKVASLTSQIYGKGENKLRIWDDRYINTRLLNFNSEVTGVTGMSQAVVTAAFRATNIPFWIGDTAVNTTVTTQGSAQLTFVNSGTVNAPLKISVGSADTVINMVKLSLQNSLTWTYTTDITTASVLTVDSRSFSVTKDGVPDLGNWNGSFFTLVPGSNTITVSMSTTGTVAPLLIEYNSRWISY